MLVVHNNGKFYSYHGDEKLYTVYAYHTKLTIRTYDITQIQHRTYVQAGNYGQFAKSWCDSCFDCKSLSHT